MLILRQACFKWRFGFSGLFRIETAALSVPFTLPGGVGGADGPATNRSSRGAECRSMGVLDHLTGVPHAIRPPLVGPNYDFKTLGGIPHIPEWLNGR
jgi:hypothetical protein